MALATLDETKRFMRVDNTNFDALLNELIESATRAIKSHTKRELEVPSVDIVEDHDGRFEGVIFLREFPIVTVTDVNDDLNRVFASGTIIPSADFVVANDEGYIRFLFGQVFTQGVKNVRVRYKAGFSPIPEDLRLASIKLVAHWFNLREQSGYASKSLLEGSVSFEFNHEIPGDVKALLAPFLRKDVA